MEEDEEDAIRAKNGLCVPFMGSPYEASFNFREDKNGIPKFLLVDE